MTTSDQQAVARHQEDVLLAADTLAWFRKYAPERLVRRPCYDDDDQGATA